uniref:Exocyst complex component Sec10 n=1 Tax=Macrostomum lignano TaxID=282301 RepID=A0A1I8FAN6_9PLAT
VLQQQQVGPHNLLQHIFSGASEEQARRPGSALRPASVTELRVLFQRAKELADIFFRYIYDEHVTYGLRLAALGLPQTDEVAQRPNLSFLEAVREANMIFHLCESKYSEILAPRLNPRLVALRHSLLRLVQLVQERRRAISCGLEAQIQQGLERTLAAIVGHVRHLLNSEQKAADFRPPIGGSDGGASISGGATHACAQVCAYISGHVVGRLAFLDGKNGQLFRDELGIRLYSTCHKFKYSLSGGLQALCDLTEYMACLKPVRHSGFLVDGHDLYDVLCKLLNLLVIQPANLHDICEEESLRSLSREVKQSFIMLRTDSGSAEVHNW